MSDEPSPTRDLMTLPDMPPDIQADEIVIIDRLICGATLIDACAEAGTKLSSFQYRMSRRASLTKCVARAREAAADVIADRLLNITKEEPDHNKARIISGNLQWILARRYRARFGDSLDLQVNQTIDINAALAAARARVRPVSDQDSDVTDLIPNESGTYVTRTTDKQSDPLLMPSMPSIFD